MIESLECRDLFSATLAGAEPVETDGGTDVAVEKIVIVHEGMSRESSTASLSEIVVTKVTDAGSTRLFR